MKEIERAALAKVITNATPNRGDYVRVDRETLVATGVDPYTKAYADWLTEHKLRQVKRRRDIFSIGRQQ